jgi:hypothetical protein
MWGRSYPISATGTSKTSAPTVVIDPPPAGGVQATATATIVGGAVTSVAVTNQGEGYTSAPGVSFTGGSGSGAAAASSLAGGSHGFARDSGGVITAIILPTGDPLGTCRAGAINAGGAIVGTVGIGPACHGYSRDPGGSITAVDIPSATSTIVNGINGGGTLVGSWIGPGGSQGFMKVGSTVTALSVPGSLLTCPSGINDAGTVVGWYMDATGTYHGFIYN